MLCCVRERRWMFTSSCIYVMSRCLGNGIFGIATGCRAAGCIGGFCILSRLRLPCLRGRQGCFRSQWAGQLLCFWDGLAGDCRSVLVGWVMKLPAAADLLQRGGQDKVAGTRLAWYKLRFCLFFFVGLLGPLGVGRGGSDALLAGLRVAIRGSFRS